MSIKKINIKEFRELGFLQEANRLFFHPLGLALEVKIDDETGEETLGGIWDYRDDPEGITYDIAGDVGSGDAEIVNAMVDKMDHVNIEREKHKQARCLLFGNDCEIEPLPENHIP